MDWGDLLTRWTVRLALALYVLALTLRVRATRRCSSQSLARLMWTAACVALLLHLVCAFQFYHRWSHAAAHEATARQTAEVVGLAWGGGLSGNYAFAALWVMDACWWWFRPDGYQARSRAIEWAVQGFLAFIAFNATVVFGKGMIRWMGLAACLFLAVVLGYAAYVRRSSARNMSGKV
jgi:hypothetical protein